MDVILNDYSLDNQFLDIDDFISSIKSTTLPMLNFLEGLAKERHATNVMYKSVKSFSRKIFQNKTLQDLFKYSANKSAIQKLLVSLSICKKPFWEDNPKTDIKNSILIDGISEIPNCITEAFYRNICSISFYKSQYSSNNISFQIDKKKVNAINAVSKQQFIESLPTCYGIQIKEGQDIEYCRKQVFFEVRDNEQGEHNAPHFHLTEKKGKRRSVSIQINTSFTVLAGDKSLRDEWLEWCKNNNYYIKEMWNYRHPERLVEDKS